MPLPRRRSAIVLVCLSACVLACRPPDGKASRAEAPSAAPPAPPALVAAPAPSPPVPQAPEPPEPKPEPKQKPKPEPKPKPKLPSVDQRERPLSPAPAPDPLDTVYLGVHRLGVNRIADSRRLGEVSIARTADGSLTLAGGLSGSGDAAAFRIKLVGTVIPKGAREFVLDGEISGVPDMRWAGEPPRERRTRGRFTFRAKGKRRYFRMYEVNGRDCVCGEGCGNDFCYIDIDIATVAAP